MRVRLVALCLCLALPALPDEATADEATAQESVELLFVGDVSFAGRRAKGKRIGANDNPFRDVKSRFEQATFVIANGEGLLNSTSPAAYGEARLNIGASPKWAPTYASSGVDLVGLANNHTWDAGAAGLLENRQHLVDSGVAVYGAGADPKEAEAPYVLDGPRGNCRVSIIPATLKSNRRPQPGASAAYYRGKTGLARLGALISEQKMAGCFVIVSVHWGREAVHQPPRTVVAAAHSMVNAGADVVVGHHPHVLQGVEFYKKGAIAYSLGNFVFTNRNPDKRETGMLAVRLSKTGPVRRLEFAFVPAMIQTRGFFPKLSTPKQRRRTLGRFAAWSKRFGTRVVERGARIIFAK
jgi:poly-gamma-glutamate capsule biosynthesis protein CapA/YwtB (metallophosphatase superfamily)